jgi:hypothetical protein
VNKLAHQIKSDFAKMITPKFQLQQTDDFIIVTIHAPYVKVVLYLPYLCAGDRGGFYNPREAVQVFRVPLLSSVCELTQTIKSLTQDLLLHQNLSKMVVSMQNTTLTLVG